jgi:hypothetical protein
VLLFASRHATSIPAHFAADGWC